MGGYDYIIIGAGSAGCVLANRLTADGRHKVLLLEAGPTDRRFFIRMPIGYGKTFHDPAVNWRYFTEPEDALDGRRGYWPRGKVLGGSSSINAMVYIRGQPGDFDDWAALGNKGWAWRDVLPYFLRMEDSDREPDAFRARGGPLHVTDVSRQLHPLCQTWLQAAHEAGFPVTEDFNGPRGEGVGLYEINVKNGVRVSSATAYLQPARHRPNLEVHTNAHVTHINCLGTKARGVAYVRDGKQEHATAEREIILCAGSIGTPAILQRSGIGDAARLRELEIPVKLDQPNVGRHLQDHLCIDYLYRARVPTLNEELGPWLGKLKHGLRYVLTRTGPLALSVNQGGGFVRSRVGLDRPDIQLYFSPLSYTRATPGKRALMRPDPFPGFLLSAQPCRPTSRGHLHITSRDPQAAPAIVPNSLSTEHDVDALIAGARLLMKLAGTPAMRGIIDHRMEPPEDTINDATAIDPGLIDSRVDPGLLNAASFITSDAQLLADIRQRASSVFHPVSTCRMGPDPRTAVVDAKLRVHGLEHLRVIDASVFPTVTSGNTHAPVVMVAEKGADLVLADARQ